jgi:hypothetical protein
MPLATKPLRRACALMVVLSDLRLGDVDGDGRCDVAAGGLVSSGGTAPWRPL